MPHYSVEIITGKIAEHEPLKVAGRDNTYISSFGYCTPMTFNSYFDTYKKSKSFRTDLLLFRDDLARDLLFDYVSAIKKLSIRSMDTWWGILSNKYSENDKISWEKFGCNYYGSSVDVEGLVLFLQTLKLKQSNYVRYTRSNHVTG